MKKRKIQLYIEEWVYNWVHEKEGVAGDIFTRAVVSYYGLEMLRKEAENETLQKGFE